MNGISLKVEIIASKSKVFCAVQARTKTNTHTYKRKRTYHPVVAMHSRQDLHIKRLTLELN